MGYNSDYLLINPNSKPTYGVLNQFTAIEPPLWAGIIASHYRTLGKSVSILDAEALNLTVDETVKEAERFNPLQVIIVVMGNNPSVSSTPKMGVTKDLVGLLKGKVALSVTGLHPSALVEETERDLGVPVLVGKIFDGMPPVAWDLLPMEKYRAHNWHCLADLDKRSPYGVIYTSLGCPYQCVFCPIHALYSEQRKVLFREPVKVLKEIDSLVNQYGVRNIKLWDELFTLNNDYVGKVCDLLIDRDYHLNIWAYGSVNTVNKSMLQKMKAAGINWIAYGFESIWEAVRLAVHKNFSQRRMKEVIEMTRDAGINIIANFIVGLPDDDLGTMQESLNVAKYFNFEYLNIYALAPYPGSRLYKEAVSRGVKLPEKWEDWAQFSPNFIPMPTKHVSAEEVLKFRDKAFIEYFDRPGYLQMIEGKFGVNAREHIEEMLRARVARKL